jgi:hypothetical protein
MLNALSVTILAFKANKFILHKTFSIFGDRFVAFLARNLGMSTIQWKGRFVMVEHRNLPRFLLMAALTIGNPIFFKLPEMLILMTGSALMRNPLELPLGSC